MREIKFRALFRNINSRKTCWQHVVPNYKLEDIGPYIQISEWEQFTGLRDKNGVEIYEGDLLSFCRERFPDDDPQPYLVVFEDGCFRVSYKNWGKTLPRPILDHRQLKILSDEVIGNIHENPEFLDAILEVK